MKKFFTIVFSIILAFSLTACKGGDDNKVIRVNEVTHSILYAPFYVAIEGKFFENEGLTIELTNGGGSDASMTALLSNGCDIALLGPETGIYTLLGGAQAKPVIFAQLTKRDGSFLMSRTPIENFSWESLAGSEIIAGRRGGSPAMSLEYALNKNGLYNGQNVTLNFDVQFNLTSAAFLSGTGDYVTMFEPTASEYMRQGKAYIVASVGQESGEAPFTCFMAKNEYLSKNKEMVEKFMTAMYKAIKYMQETPVDTLADLLLNQFPSTTKQSIIDSLNSYISIDAWQTDMIMSEQAFERLQDIMENAGELNERVSINQLVDNKIAEDTYKKIFG